MMRNSYTKPAVALSALSLCALAQGGDTCTPMIDTSLGTPGFTGYVSDFQMYGGSLYAIGAFGSADGNAGTALIARWDGSEWVSVGGGMEPAAQFANTLAVFDGDLYAGGYQDTAGGVAGTAKIARWDGTSWHPLGPGGAQLEFFTNSVWDLAAWDDGDGEALYIAGNYTDIGGAGGPDFIARWDGSAFSELDGTIGGAGIPLIVLTVESSTVGGTNALYIGGRFSEVGGVSADAIAGWDGENWFDIGGIQGDSVFTRQVFDIFPWDDGTGEALYVGGAFLSAGGVDAPRVAKWDGKQWHAMGDGFNGAVRDFAVYDDGTGEALYAAGDFTASGTTPINGLARWNGESWEPVDGASFNDDVFVITPWNGNDGTQPTTLLAGGTYTQVSGQSANSAAEYVGCPDETVPGDLDGDSEVGVSDLLILLGAWGDCDGCAEDLDEDGTVGVSDLLQLLSAWS